MRAIFGPESKKFVSLLRETKSKHFSFFLKFFWWVSGVNDDFLCNTKEETRRPPFVQKKKKKREEEEEEEDDDDDDDDQRRRKIEMRVVVSSVWPLGSCARRDTTWLETCFFLD